MSISVLGLHVGHPSIKQGAATDACDGVGARLWGGAATLATTAELPATAGEADTPNLLMLSINPRRVLDVPLPLDKSAKSWSLCGLGS